MLTYTREVSRQEEPGGTHLDLITYVFSDGEVWRHVTRWERARGKGMRSWRRNPPVVLRNGVRVRYAALGERLEGAEEIS